MMLLPIVQRELRVGARLTWPRWARVAAIGLVTCVCFQFFSAYNPRGGGAGRGVFEALAWTIFLFAACMFAVTADTLSRERREGTLVLLFLTDLNGYDVVLGRLAGSALNVLFVVLGFTPLLMLPVLAGGVTWPETVRLALAVVNTAFISLAVGGWCSVRGAQTYTVMRSAVVWLVVVMLGPDTLALCLPAAWKGAVLCVSPLFAFTASDEPSYVVAGRLYWRSLAWGQLLGWALIGLACWTLMRNWREEFRAKWRFNPVLARRARLRRRMHGRAAVKLGPLYRSFAPVAGAVLRVPGLRAAAWGGGLLSWLAGFLIVFGGFSFWGLMTYGIYTGLHFTAVGLFAWLGARFLCDARRSGELELLVTTPGGANGIVRDHWFAVMRLLRGPLLLAGVGALPSAALSVSAAGLRGGGELFGVLQGVCSMANAILSVFAICWVGMWQGLSARRPSTAVLWTVGLAEAIPLAVVTVLPWLVGALARAGGSFGPGLWLWLTAGPFLMLAKNIFFIAWAHHQLCAALRAPRAFVAGARRRTADHADSPPPVPVASESPEA